MRALREPSTWAGLAAGVAAVGPLFLAQPIVGALAGLFGAIAMVLREQGGKPPAP